jgi:aspartyl/asparaginyl beta-hydroxylase (cupin superfamily)
MPSPDEAAVLTSLKEGADNALRRADPQGARELFLRAIVLAPDRIDLQMGLAACERVLGDLTAGLGAVERALAIEPRFFPALLMKGSLLEGLGQKNRAALTYGIAAKLAPAAESLPEPTRRALRHAIEFHDAYAGELTAALRSEARLDDFSSTSTSRRTAEIFIESMAGRRRIFQQEPVQFHYPGLPAIEFHDRRFFPWLEALESQTDEIRNELLSVWADGSPGLEPYVSYPPGVPLDQWSELNHSLSWTAFHLWYYGAPLELNCQRCPRTVAALEVVDQPHIHGRSPAAMFSILKPHTRIPSHTGVSNTRLVVHLPLVVPDGCGFRVGGETRQWREGEAWVFDDTIEHEAWNESAHPRAILICDCWAPSLSMEERELISRLTLALDSFNGGHPVGDGL